jgi:hypothetical protein
MTLHRIPALALAGVALTACISTEPQPTHDYGFVVLVGEENAGGSTVIADPIAYFLRTSNLSVSENGATNDECTIGQIPESNAPQPGLPYLDAGSLVTVLATEQPPILLERSEPVPSQILYRKAGDFAYTPGTAITASVSGSDGGFPEMSVTGTTATPFEVSEVPIGDSPASTIALSWDTPPTAGRTTMNVSLRFAEAAGEINRQIFCTLVDDGSYTIPQLQAEGWNTSENDLREALFERVRIELEESEETMSTLVLFSTFLVRADVEAPPAAATIAR